MKCIVSLLLTLVMVMGICSFAMAEESDNPWKDLDLSEYTEINFYVPGIEPADFQEIIGLVNDRMKELINTKVNITWVSYADFGTKLSLFLAGDEDIDLVYGAYWFTFGDYVANGGYKGFDWDFVEKYMPMTAKTQAPSSWKEMEYGDKYYGITNNRSGIGASGVWTRQELLDKYGFKAEDFKTFDDLTPYFDAIAADTPNTGCYVFNPQCTYPMDTMGLVTGVNHYWDVNGGTADWMALDYNSGKEFDVNDLQWVFEMPEYRAFCLKMADWYKKGYFPASVISNGTLVDDNFNAGSGAFTFGSPTTVESTRNNVIGNDPVFINCLWDDESHTRRGNYFCYCVGFPPASKKMERAATCLDCMKNDPQIHTWLNAGIEGRHYNLTEDGKYYTLGPEAADYPIGSFTNNSATQSDADPDPLIPAEYQAYQDMYEAAELPPETFPINGFNYVTNYEAELSALTALFNEYRFSFCFGIFGDQTEAKLDDFIAQCKAIGIDDVINDYRTQLAAFIAEK